MAKAKSTTKRTVRKRTPKKAAAGSRGILPQDSRLDAAPDDAGRDTALHRAPAPAARVPEALEAPCGAAAGGPRHEPRR